MPVVKLSRASIVALALLSSCADEPVPQHPDRLEVVDEVVERVGAAGGSLTLISADGGQVELRIPAGALPNDESITLKRSPAASWPPETAAAPVVGSTVLELLPDGLAFESPVSLVTRHPAAPAGLVDGSRRTIPSHVSCSAAGTITRHPIASSKRADGRAATVGRVPHFSAHWTSTASAGGQYAVDLAWPTTVGRVGEVLAPSTFGLWTSRAAPPPHDVRYAFFVEFGSGGVLEATPFETMDQTAEVMFALVELLTAHLEEVEGAPAFTPAAVGAARTAGFLEDGTFDFLFSDQPAFLCVGEGTATAWIAVEIMIPDEGGALLPTLYAEELSFECTAASPTDGGVDEDAGSLDAGDLDAGVLDAGDLDAGVLDAGVLDADVLDADVDAG